MTDRCPGLVRPYLSADGALVRLRVPGGQVRAAALAGLGALAEQYGDGLVQITSRANLQLRGIALTDGAVDRGLAAGIEDLGLNPAPSHELVRNIAASPLSGLAGGVRDIRRLIGELDRGLISRPCLAELPGRFLFAVDDGRGDQEGFDLGLVADGDGVRVLVGDFIGGVYSDEDGVRRLLDLAEEFLVRRGSAWRVRELPEQGLELGERLERRTRPASAGLEVGVHGSALVVMPRLGRLARQQIELLAGRAGRGAIGGRAERGATGGRAGRGTSPVIETTTAGRLVLTPGRQIVIPDGAPYAAELAAVGLESDPASPWTLITACAGAAGCANGQFATYPAAAHVAQQIGEGEYADALPIHVAACDRLCGVPRGPHHLVTSAR